MLKLYRFSVRWTRTDDITGIFAAEEAEVVAAYGVQGHLDEPLGRYSSGPLTLKAEDLTVLTDDQAFIAKAIEYRLLPTGVNPLWALTCEKCGDTLRAPYQKCRHARCGWKRGDKI